MLKINDYSDIINYKYLGPKKHVHMSLYNRASQFQPFAALTGYDEAIKNSVIIPNKKIILNEEEATIINDKLLIIDNNLNNNLSVSITYFIYDNDKKNGKYETINGTVRYIDKVNNLLILKDKTKINIDDIIDINLYL